MSDQVDLLLDYITELRTVLDLIGSHHVAGEPAAILSDKGNPVCFCVECGKLWPCPTAGALRLVPV